MDTKITKTLKHAFEEILKSNSPFLTKKCTTTDVDDKLSLLFFLCSH